ncbi:MAG: hydantoinase/carbamoylase family amidase [Acidimicrobiales bacterium]|nr:hydantoinase/carbamoylase family amidase [Acidimicrobiales bacterium]
MVEVDGERLLESLQTLRGFGAVGSGVVRPTFSGPDMAARRWLRDQMEAAGLDAVVDGVGNVFGRSRNGGPALVIGSHSDTQPEGGWLDGALGVMYAIEVARALAELDSTRRLAVDVAAWSDEEGTYANFLGSRSFIGDLADGDMASTNTAGESVAEAIERVGLSHEPRVALDPARHIGYIEAHIEQGPHLEERGRRIGVVTSIVGMRTLQISFSGRQNHAGTTPMARRSDAGVALFDFGVRVRSRLESIAGPATVWTIGNARLEPGAESIVPGSAWCGLQFRDADEAVLDTVEAAVRDLAAEMTAEGPVAVSAARRRDPVTATDMSAELRRHLATAADARVRDGWTEMPSAAAHDAMVIAKSVPSAMLFIPSIDGISHDFAENSHDEDIVLGCQVLVDAAISILEP